VTPQNDDLAAARTGDQSAFGRLIEARWPRLVRLARSIVGDLDADDVAQDGCVLCWRHLSQLADPDKFDSWLMRIVYRAAVHRARWQRVRAAMLFEPAWMSGLGRDPSAEAGGEPGGNLLVWQVLSHLPARQRAVLHLTVVEGMSDSEIADALGIRAGSVRAHRRRARQQVESWWQRGPEREARDDGPRAVRRSLPAVGRAAAGDERR
jgi:RNA polymerase sigma factor (sigma-70 family)